MKKAVSIVIIGLILLTAVSTVFAATTVSASKQTAEPGDTVIISGTVNADASIVIKIVDSGGSIVYFGAVKADSSGNYSASFTVPTDIVDGTLTVTVGSGSDTATTTIVVKAPPKPTAQPTETPTAQPTATPTKQPTATPTAQPTAQRMEQPTANSEYQTATSVPAKVITPIESEQDKDTGNITILIDTGDLPAGTVKLKLSDGTTIDMGNEETVEFTVSVDDINADGTIEIIALDEEGVSLAALSVQTNEKSELGGLNLLWWILGGLVIVTIALAVYTILRKRKFG